MRTKLLFLLSVFCFPLLGLPQTPVVQTTPYSRGLLRSSDAASARNTLGILATNGLLIGAIGNIYTNGVVTTNGFATLDAPLHKNVLAAPLPYKSIDPYLAYGTFVPAATITNLALDIMKWEPQYDTFFFDFQCIDALNADGTMHFSTTTFPQGPTNMVLWLKSIGFKHVGINVVSGAGTWGGQPGVPFDDFGVVARQLIGCGFDVMADDSPPDINDGAHDAELNYVQNLWMQAFNFTNANMALRMSCGNYGDPTVAARSMAAAYFNCPGSEWYTNGATASHEGADNHFWNESSALTNRWIAIMHDWDMEWPYLPVNGPGHWVTRDWDAILGSYPNTARVVMGSGCIGPSALSLIQPIEPTPGTYGNSAAYPYFTNPTALSIYDDPLAIHGTVIMSSNVIGGGLGGNSSWPDGWQVVTRPLTGGNYALFMLNRVSATGPYAGPAVTLSVPLTYFGVPTNTPCLVQDIFTNINPAGYFLATNALMVTVQPADCGFFKIFPNESSLPAPTNISLSSPLDSGLIFDATLNEGSGTNVNDYSANPSSPGQIIGGDWAWQPGLVGPALETVNTAAQAIDPPSITNAVWFPYTTKWANLTNLTVEVLFEQPAFSSGGPRLLEVADIYSPPYGLTLGVGSGPYSIGLKLENAAGTQATPYWPTSAAGDGQWHDAVLEWNGASIAAYMDGVPLAAGNPAQTNFTGVITNLVTRSAPYVMLGAMNGGAIGQVRAWSRALNTNEITLLYRQSFHTVSTADLTGSIPTTSLSGTIPTSSLSGTFPTSRLNGTLTNAIGSLNTAPTGSFGTTGWTNTTSSTMVLYFGLQSGSAYTVYNAAGASIYSLGTLASGTSVSISTAILQPGGWLVGSGLSSGTYSPL